MVMLSPTVVNGTRVDIAAVKAASKGPIGFLVRAWLPHGKKVGDEWVATNPTRSDRKPGSFKINLKTGQWSDFATGDKGGDMIDLLVYLRGISTIEAAREIGELLSVPAQRSAEIHLLPTSNRTSAVLPPELVTIDPETLPSRTPPDADGKPRFFVAGDEGARVWPDEARRHAYRIGSVPVRVKVMRKGESRAMNWYRVVDGAVSGWQAKKPDGYRDVPFIAALDPFAPEHVDQDVHWPEGEKDVETLTNKGFFAFTFGGVGDGLPAGCEAYVSGRNVVIYADNDAEGRHHAEMKAAIASPVAASVKIVYFHELAEKGDVSDWMAEGGTADRLREIVAETALYSTGRLSDATESTPEPAITIKATPYSWTSPESLPMREFVYGKHLIRKFVSATVAPGGVGKSSLETTDALAMVSGQDLAGVQPHGRSRVWLWNLEDPLDEVRRHVQATARHFGLSAADLEGYLFVDSGRDQRLVVAKTDRNQATIVEPVVESLVSELIARQIDVLIIDPFVSCHEVPENDNGGMDRVVKLWGRVADRAGCAIELVHHTRKNSSGDTEITVESSRGGKALTDGCRSVRVLNRMSKEEGEKAGVESARQYFRTYIDKQNLAPAAEHSDWFKIESVNLGNGPFGHGDSVGVVAPWKWPDLMADVTVSDLRKVQTVISKGRYRENFQAANWAGKAVAEAMGLDVEKDRRKIAHLIKTWVGTGVLQKVQAQDEKGNLRPFIEVGEWAND